MLGRIPYGCDINPVSLAFVAPRLRPPTLEAVAGRLTQIDLSKAWESAGELLVFYHADTLRQIVALKEYFLRRLSDGDFDAFLAAIGSSKPTCR